MALNYIDVIWVMELQSGPEMLSMFAHVKCDMDFG